MILPFVVWFRFRVIRRYLAYRPGEVSRVYRLLERAAEGGPGHGPVHLLLQSAAVIGFRGILRNCLGIRLVCPF